MRFRELTSDDMEMHHQWLQRPHVKEWWDDGDDTINKVVNHYTSNPDTTQRFVLLDASGRPIGFFQYCFTDEGIGIDQFIAEESLLGKGLGQAAIKGFIRLICDQHHPQVILTDPSPKNKRAIRCYSKLGFQHSATTVGHGGKMAYNMKLPIADYSQG